MIVDVVPLRLCSLIAWYSGSEYHSSACFADGKQNNITPPSYADPLLPLSPSVLPLESSISGAIVAAIGSTSKTGPLSEKAY